MTDFPRTTQRAPIFSVLMALFVFAAGYLIVGQFIGLSIVAAIYPGHDFLTQMTLEQTSGNWPPGVRTPWIAFLAATHLFGLIIFPYFVYRWIDKRDLRLLVRPVKSWALIGIPILLVVASVPIIERAVVWNQNIVFPASWQAFELWARHTEEHLSKLMAFIATTDSIPQLVVLFMVLALLPAVGEELIFRGLLQTELQRLTRSGHLAIIICALLFSAIHLQFYGFFPRFALGVIFGYCYFWTNNLIVPIVAHFTNNAIAVVGMFLSHNKIIENDWAEKNIVRWPILGMSIILFFTLAFIFKTRVARVKK